MNNGGDAAEQVVRLSLEGFEVAARLTGEAAKNVAVLLAAALKEEHKTQGKTRLTNMIRSGKELKVFSVPEKDLNKFVEQAKRYGVLYCVLQDKSENGGDVPVDIIARAEDASKIQRIFERFALGQVDKASIVTEAENDRQKREQKENREAVPEREQAGESHKNGGQEEMSMGEMLMSGMIFTDEAEPEPEAATTTETVPETDRAAERGEAQGVNPRAAEPESESPSARSSEQAGDSFEKMDGLPEKKPSVKEKLERFKKEAAQQRDGQEKNRGRQKGKLRKKTRTGKTSGKKKQTRKER